MKVPPSTEGVKKGRTNEMEGVFLHTFSRSRCEDPWQVTKLIKREGDHKGVMVVAVRCGA